MAKITVWMLGRCYTPSVVNSKQDQKTLSKFLSKVLRHEPSAANVSLDARGFCEIDALLKGASHKLRFPVSREDLIELAQPVEGDKKQRFEVEGDYIRAGHGHSVTISSYETLDPTGPLYHAAPQSAIEAIKSEGLLPMTRQKVHLSYDRKITLEAARRKSRDVRLVEVLYRAAQAEGHEFFKSADPRIVLCDALPPKHLKVHPLH